MRRRLRRVDLYALCWNEMRMLPYFFRHYRPFVDRFVIHDDGSTDGSREFLEAQADVELHTFERTSDVFIDDAVPFYAHAWKQSRGKAAWVIVVNVDEHMYQPDMRSYLEECRKRGVTVVRPYGFEMVAEAFPDVPRRLCDVVVQGAPSRKMDKLAIFDPSGVDEIGYEPGRHRAFPEGRIRYPAVREVKLLHYKHLGLEYVAERYAELAKRFPAGFKTRYRRPDVLRRRFETLAGEAVRVV